MVAAKGRVLEVLYLLDSAVAKFAQRASSATTSTQQLSQCIHHALSATKRNAYIRRRKIGGRSSFYSSSYIFLYPDIHTYIHVTPG